MENMVKDGDCPSVDSPDTPLSYSNFMGNNLEYCEDIKSSTLTLINLGIGER